MFAQTNRSRIQLSPLIGPSRPPPCFKSTEDLLSKFQLLSAYDSYVRPFLPPEDMSSDKGKGKQRDTPPIPDPHSIHINDPDDDELDRRKKKNNYKHLIKGIPGSITLCVSFPPPTFIHSSHRETLNQKGRLFDRYHASTTKATYRYRPIRFSHTAGRLFCWPRRFEGGESIYTHPHKPLTGVGDVAP